MLTAKKKVIQYGLGPTGLIGTTTATSGSGPTGLIGTAGTGLAGQQMISEYDEEIAAQDKIDRKAAIKATKEKVC